MKRVGIASLWFISVFCIHELVWSLAGSPRVLGLFLGAAAAAFVLIDPIHVLVRASAAESMPGAKVGAAQIVGR